MRLSERLLLLGPEIHIVIIVALIVSLSAEFFTDFFSDLSLTKFLAALLMLLSAVYYTRIAMESDRLWREAVSRCSSTDHLVNIVRQLIELRGEERTRQKVRHAFHRALAFFVAGILMRSCPTIYLSQGLTQFLANGIVSGFVYALVAFSFALIYLPTRFFHFAHGAVFAWGAYFGYICVTVLKLPLWVALPLAVGMTAMLGAGLEVGIYRPLRRRKATGLVLLLASLGLYVVLQNLISLLFGDEVKSLRSGEVTEGYPILGAYITPIQLCIVFAALFSFAFVGAVLKFTRFGKALRAVASDAELARVHGVNSDGVVLGAFALGSALAALAALLVALDVDMTPTMGLNALMMGVVAMIVGGVGSVPGTLMGGLLLGLAQHLGVWRIGSEWQDAIAFAILLVFVLFRPHGIMGRPTRRTAV